MAFFLAEQQKAVQRRVTAIRWACVRARRACGFSVAGCAGALGVPAEKLKRIEAGTATLSVEMVHRMAVVYDVPVESLLSYQMFGRVAEPCPS